MVRARQARAAHGLGDPLVEGAALLPEAVVPLVLPFREVGVLVVQIVPRLRHDGHALARELPEAVHGLFQEFRVVDHLVVVQEHHGVEAEHVGHEQAQIADGAVALKADLFGEALDVLLGHALLDKRQLRRADDERRHVRVAIGDGLHLLCRLHFQRHIGGHEDDHESQALHLRQRFQAAAELTLLVGGGGVVVGAHHIGPSAVAAGVDERGNDDDGVHGGPFEFSRRVLHHFSAFASGGNLGRQNVMNGTRRHGEDHSAHTRGIVAVAPCYRRRRPPLGAPARRRLVSLTFSLFMRRASSRRSRMAAISC